MSGFKYVLKHRYLKNTNNITMDFPKRFVLVGIMMNTAINSWERDLTMGVFQGNKRVAIPGEALSLFTNLLSLREDVDLTDYENEDGIYLFAALSGGGIGQFDVAGVGALKHRVVIYLERVNIN